jgi:hypothetical protein
VAVEWSFNRWLESLIIMEVGEPGKLRIYEFLAHKLGPLPFQQWPMFRHASQSATSLRFESVACIQGLLTTLSSVNTRKCPEIRTHFLRFLGDLTKDKYGYSHPFAVVARMLQDDGECQDVSERALLYMLEMFDTRLGSFHPLGCEAHTALARLLRRDHDFEGSRNLAQKLLDALQAKFGRQSLEARKAARELEHVLMDIGDYSQAIQLCFSIVGQDIYPSILVEPQYQDECAVYIMEDIAKIYEVLGDVEMSTVWLKQALIAAWNLLTMGWIGVDHIVDKLETLLVRCGKTDEAAFWRISSPTYV